MATYYAQNATAANINTAIWYTAPTGGTLQDWATVVSQDAVAVLVANGRSINVNVGFTAGNIRNDTTGGATTGGGFTVTVDGVVINANIIVGGATCLTLSGTVGATVNGNVTGSATSNVFGILHVSTGVLNVTGNLVAGNGTNSSAIQITAANTLNVTGSITGGGVGAAYGINCSGAAIITVSNGTLSGSAWTAINMTAGTLNATNVTVNSLGINLSASVIATVSGSVTTTTTQSAIASAGNLTITGNLTNPVAGNALNVSGGTTTVTGNVTANSAHCIILGNATLTVNGNVTGGTVSASNGINITGNFNATVNGNVTGGSGSSTNSCGVLVFTSAVGVVTINGTATGGAIGAGVGSQSTASTIIINGTAVGGSGGPGALNNSTGTMIVTRAKGNGFGIGSTGLTAQVGLANVSSGLCYVQETELGDLGLFPTSGAVILIDVPSNVALLYRPGLSKQTLVDANATSGLLPAAANVRRGVSYGAGNLTGTMAVPTADQVRNGVTVDNTTGTAVLTADKLWDELTSNVRIAGSFGERLAQVSTVATTGQQLADGLG